MSHNNYGVRTFDLSVSRENKRIRIRADRLNVVRADDTVDLRIGSPNAPAIPLRRLEEIDIEEEVKDLYLSNNAGTGKLVLLFGVGDVTASVGSAEIEGTVDVENRAAREIGKVRHQDSGGVLIDPLAVQEASEVTASTSTATTNISLSLGAFRKAVDIFADVSGSATLTVEVRKSGGSWRTADTQDYSSATTELEQYSFAYPEVRASIDQNLTELEAVGRGV